MSRPHPHLRLLPVLSEPELDAPQRPRTRGDCEGGERPCPWVSCAHHAIHGVIEGFGGASLSDDELVARIEAMPQSCVLDVADEGDATLDDVGDLWGVTRERIRQIESKALAKLPRRSETMREHLEEVPSPELRPARAGAAKPIEDRRRIVPPSQHAHLPGPEGVIDAAQAMWCPWMGAAMTGTLCARRHTARREKSLNVGAGPVYPICASCADGAALTARVGRIGELVPLRVAVPAQAIDWMGEAETDTAPAAMGAEESAMSATKPKGAGRVRQPPAGAVCIVPGCAAAPQGYLDSLEPVMRPLCARHRLAAQKERTRLQIGSAEAVSLTVRRAKDRTHARPQAPLPVAEAHTDGLFDGPPEVVRDLCTPAGDERDWLLSQRDAARADAAELRRERDESRALLTAAEARIDELDGQQLADATHRCPVSRPLARLAALARVLVPDDETIAWTVGSTRDGGRWCASALGHDDARVAAWEAVADTPDEALAALVGVVEAEARGRIEALNAALGGA